MTQYDHNSASDSNQFPIFENLFREGIYSQDLSQSELANRLGVSRTTVGRWFNEARRPGKPETVKSIAEILKIDPHELLVAAGYGIVENNRPRNAEQSNLEASAHLVDSSIQSLANSSIYNQNAEQFMPDSPPEIYTFVGRSEEIENYQEQLSTQSYCLITGLSGMGKSWLAAKLASEAPQAKQMYWHLCRKDEGVSKLLWSLSYFLYHQGRVEDYYRLCPILEKLNTSEDKAPLNTAIYHVVNQLIGYDYLICLDNFQELYDNEDVGQLVEKLLERAKEDQLKLLVTSHAPPSFVHYLIEPLRELSKRDTRLFADKLLPQYLKHYAAELYSRTSGHPLYLELSFQALRNHETPDELFNTLLQTSGIDSYLYEVLDKQLSDDERSTIKHIAILTSSGESEGLIAYILDPQPVNPSLFKLRKHNRIIWDERKNSYRLHGLLQEYFHGQLSITERKDIYGRAGRYHADKSNYISALGYYIDAEDIEESVKLVWKYIEIMISNGHTEELHTQLKRLPEQKLSGNYRFYIFAATGKVNAAMGKNEQAQIYYSEALSVETEAVSDDIVARVHIWLSSAQLALGDYYGAESSVENGLTLLDQDSRNSIIYAHAYMNHSQILYHLYNSIQGAITKTEEAIEINSVSQNSSLMRKLLQNRGIYNEKLGNWETARVDYEECLKSARELGDIFVQANVLNSLGTLYTKLGEYQNAEECLRNSIGIAEQYHLNEVTAFCWASLADLFTRLEQWEHSMSALNNVEELILSNEINHLQPYFDYLAAQCCIGYGDADKAQEYADRAYRSQIDLVVGIGMRVQGQVFAKKGKMIEAEKKFTDSLKKLEDSDQYEAECTRVVWGKLLCENGNKESGMKQIQQARKKFEEWGAQHDLANIKSQQ